MDTIDQLYKKYLTKTYERRQQQKLLLAKDYVDRFHKGEELTNRQTKTLLDCLYRNNMIEATKEIKSDERKLYFYNLLAALVGGICMVSPYGVREFRKINKFAKVLTCGTLFILGYAGTIYPSYMKVTETNKRLVRENLWKIQNLTVVLSKNEQQK